MTATHRALRLDPEGTCLVPCTIIHRSVDGERVTIRYTDTGQLGITLAEYVTPIT